jgi:hypothetical protein
MAVGDSADARVTKIKRGYGKQKTYVTVEFAGDSDRRTEKEFICESDKADRLDIDSVILVVHTKFGWQIAQSENLATGFTAF